LCRRVGHQSLEGVVAAQRFEVCVVSRLRAHLGAGGDGVAESLERGRGRTAACVHDREQVVAELAARRFVDNLRREQFGAPILPVVERGSGRRQAFLDGARRPVPGPAEFTLAQCRVRPRAFQEGALCREMLLERVNSAMALL
jgi:hypothetical protein